MNIFSVFTLSKGLKETFSQDNINAFLVFAKDKIVEQVDSNILGSEKKALVDQACETWVRAHLSSTNSIVVWIIDNLIIPNISVVTQGIFDFLKAFISGLTKN